MDCIENAGFNLCTLLESEEIDSTTESKLYEGLKVCNQIFKKAQAKVNAASNRQTGTSNPLDDELQVQKGAAIGSYRMQTRGRYGKYGGSNRRGKKHSRRGHFASKIHHVSESPGPRGKYQPTYYGRSRRSWSRYKTETSDSRSHPTSSGSSNSGSSSGSSNSGSSSGSSDGKSICKQNQR